MINEKNQAKEEVVAVLTGPDGKKRVPMTLIQKITTALFGRKR